MPTRHPGLLVLVAQKHVRTENPTFAQPRAARFRVVKVSIVRAWGLPGVCGTHPGGWDARTRKSGCKVTLSSSTAPRGCRSAVHNEELINASPLRRRMTAQAYSSTSPIGLSRRASRPTTLLAFPAACQGARCSSAESLEAKRGCLRSRGGRPVHRSITGDLRVQRWCQLTTVVELRHFVSTTSVLGPRATSLQGQEIDDDSRPQRRLGCRDLVKDDTGAP